MSPFKAATALLSSVLFFLWLLPLGIFIKSSNEKVACGGQRAICMCSHMAKASGKPVEHGVNYKGATSHQHETQAPSAASPSFMTASGSTLSFLQMAALRAQEYLSYKSPYLASLEHVPKA